MKRICFIVSFTFILWACGDNTVNRPGSENYVDSSQPLPTNTVNPPYFPDKNEATPMDSAQTPGGGSTGNEKNASGNANVGDSSIDKNYK